MLQEEITVLRVHKSTRNRLRKRAITNRESYDEIINRLLGSNAQINRVNELEKRKQKLLKMGVKKELVNLLGVIDKVDLEDEKRMVRDAIIRKMIQ